jgi:hypothetical protein
MLSPPAAYVGGKDFGVAKDEGLFKGIPRKAFIAPAQILHIGDNKHADFTPKPPKALLADKGYDSDAARETLLLHHIFARHPAKDQPP